MPDIRSIARPAELTDQEWCELCFLIVETDLARDQLRETLLGDERPTLDELWDAMKDYRQTSERMFDHLATTLRSRARISRQAA